MKMVRNRKNQIVILLAALFAAAMVIFPQTTENGSKTAISLWLNSIVPGHASFLYIFGFYKTVRRP